MKRILTAIAAAASLLITLTSCYAGYGYAEITLSAVSAARYNNDCGSRGVWLPANFEKHKAALVALLPELPADARADANHNIDKMIAESQRDYCETMFIKISQFGAVEVK